MNTILSQKKEEDKIEQKYVINDIRCTKGQLICIIVIIFILLMVFNGSFDMLKEKYKVKFFDAPPNSTLFERYGMPQMNCQDLNAIRKSSGLDPVSCSNYEEQTYSST